MKRHSEVRPHTFGLSLLMVVFMILCLITFAAISIAESKSDLARAENRLEKTKALSAAYDQAELLLEEYDLKALDSPDEAEEEVSFTISVDDMNTLDVTFRLTENSSGGPVYEISNWQLASLDGYTVDDSMNLMTDGQIGW